MADFTPLDIPSIQKRFESDGGLNGILITLVVVTLGVIGFIVYLLLSKT